MNYAPYQQQEQGRYQEKVERWIAADVIASGLLDFFCHFLLDF
jgi:hypothetical protein